MTAARRRVRIWSLRLLLIALIPPLLFTSWRWGMGNSGEVRPGTIYRSAQVSAGTLTDWLREYRIRTVLNLRGSHPEEAWYRAEREATLAAGATQVDIAMSSCEWMSRAQLSTVIEVLDHCEKPVLLHCWRGAERTGWISAIAQLLTPGATLVDARAQFSPYFLFVRAGDGQVMIEHLEQYERWLATTGRAHSSSVFREWAREGFRPGVPGREQWPYDPYPLVVETHPSPPRSYATDSVRESTSSAHRQEGSRADVLHNR